jgi:hypothetical protein
MEPKPGLENEPTTTILSTKVTPLHSIISPPETIETGETGETGETQKSTKMKKRNRKHSAQSLPKGLEHHMMKKYVVYYREWIDRQHTREREYFKIEKHPDLKKGWTSSKSCKITIFDKLATANKIIDDLEEKKKKEMEMEEKAAAEALEEAHANAEEN